MESFTHPLFQGFYGQSITTTNHWILAHFSNSSQLSSSLTETRAPKKLGDSRQIKRSALQRVTVQKQKNASIKYRKQGNTQKQFSFSQRKMNSERGDAQSRTTKEKMKKQSKQNGMKMMILPEERYKVASTPNCINKLQNRKNGLIYIKNEIKEHKKYKIKTSMSCPRCRSVSTDCEKPNNRIRNPNIVESLRGTLKPTSKNKPRSLRVSPSTNINQDTSSVFKNKFINESLGAPQKHSPATHLQNVKLCKKVKYFGEEQKYWESQRSDIEDIMLLRKLADLVKKDKGGNRAQNEIKERGLRGEDSQFLEATYLYN